ncbi:MAG: type II toxin-antitoxin system VapC family toxin [Burkholderiales bacterium]|nr:type II toxin-antitoxin system VapC family toxin [Burkholderiales bacterium]MCA3156500.1 type II toxin-antitoxin system VapC family toxin [Burkholderiales bacterium]MCA3166902.1 type II toxin-antitoxin system VapC family toxin [Burkholderiales bacterium]MCA3168990.1 type II toxin-antitoxin system VapC family toxin [Burkholderiales bacterium]MCA3176917.1 type II toxin-antitoxin system VapC family toxin [Burkholderiales bacterium]
MNLLLDTHVALWAITDSPKLSLKARELIASPRTTVWISVASVWEIAIKHALGRGDMPVSGQEAGRYFRESGYRFLPIETEHAFAVQDLAVHHHDPFDRLLVAQALVEPMRLMTHDPMVARYSDTIIKI